MAVNLVTVTTTNRVRLYQGQPGTSSAAVYTVLTGDVKLASIVVANTTAAPATITLSVVPSGGTAGAANRVLSAMSVGANDTLILDSGIYMTTGDFIAALQGTAAALTVTISGETYA